MGMVSGKGVDIHKFENRIDRTGDGSLPFFTAVLKSFAGMVGYAAVRRDAAVCRLEI